MALSATACALAAAPAAAADDHVVTFPTTPFGGPYTPDAVTAAPGDTVTFQGGFSSHPLVWDEGDFATQSDGVSYSFPFARPGTYRFHCQVHGASMTGTVTVPGNQAPSAYFTAAPAEPRTGEPVTFTATGSDPDGTIARYEWDLDGDGSFEARGAQPTRTYTSAGTVAVRVRAIDDGHDPSPVTSHELRVTQATAGGGQPPAPPAAGGSGGGGAPDPVGGGEPAAGGPSGTSPDTAAPATRLASRTLRVRGGRVVVRLSATEPGRATLSLRAGGRTLATGAGAVGMTARTLRLRLTKAGRRARAVRARLQVVVRDAAGNRRTTSFAVRLRR